MATASDKEGAEPHSELQLRTRAWLTRHADLYRKATFHPFIENIRNGSLDFNCFKRWLGQDYIFVREFVRFLASVLLKAPKDTANEDIDLILGGLVALNQELSWFKKEASIWEVDFLSTNPQKANKEYCRFIESLMQPEVEYAVIIVALWAIEVVYCDSFAICLDADAKTPPALLEACQRWGNEGFKQYCVSLQKIADKALDNASHDVQQKAEEAFVQVKNHEDIAFLVKILSLRTRSRQQGEIIGGCPPSLTPKRKPRDPRDSLQQLEIKGNQANSRLSAPKAHFTCSQVDSSPTF